MKNISELTDFYYKSLYPTLQELEKDRKQLRYRILLIGSVYTFVAILIALAVLKYMSLDILAFIGIGYLGLGGFLYKFLVKDYTKEFKEKVIRPLIMALDTKLKYTPSLHVPQHTFERSQLFTSDIDRMNGNDFVRGEIDGIKIEFSDIHAEEQHKDSKGHTNWSTIFQGLFIVSEFNKTFHGRTVILPDTAQSTFGNLIGGWL